jgi:hypothetical protein
MGQVRGVVCGITYRCWKGGNNTAENGILETGMGLGEAMSSGFAPQEAEKQFRDAHGDVIWMYQISDKRCRNIDAGISIRRMVGCGRGQEHIWMNVNKNGMR